MPKKSLRQQKGAMDSKETPSRKMARREEVYRKAKKLFRQKGYLRTTMNDIARGLNMQKGSLYYYTKDKETVLYEILAQTMDGILGRIPRDSLDDLSPEEKLRLIAHVHFTNLQIYSDELWLLINEGKNLSRDRRERLEKKRERYERVFLEVIEEGMSKGVFANHNKHLVAYFVLGGMYWLFQWFSPKDMVAEQVDEEQFLKLFFNGLLVDRKR